MSSKPDPEWEVVDEIPGEKPEPKPPKPGKSLWRRKTLWIGLALGATAVIAFPMLRALLQNLLRAWWLWLGLAVYWYWMRLQRLKSRR